MMPISSSILDKVGTNQIKMTPKQNNYAYIDGANLHKGVGDLGWELDYARFRVWLKHKYDIQTAYLFIGLIPKYKDLYTHLQEVGFTLIFKETTAILSPSNHCSILLKRTNARILYLDWIRSKIDKK
jgi:hypothetical protein